MGVRRKRGRMMVCLLVFASLWLGMLFTITTTSVQAQETTEVTTSYFFEKEEKEESSKEDTSESEDNHVEDGVGNTNNGCEAYTSKKDREQCMQDRNASTKTADFYTQAILSLDSDIQAQEVKEDYIVNFSNSSATAVAYDIWLADPPTILMHIINTVTTIIEKIGSFVSLAVLILYNVASSSFWTTIMREIFQVVDAVLFDWGNENSWFLKIVVLFGCVGIAKRLMKAKKATFGIKTFLNAIFEVVLSCVLVVFIARYGRPLIVYTETLVSESIVETFSFGENKDNTPIEIQNKQLIFDTLQKQGFILRHFGVTDVSKISDVNSGDYRSAAEGAEIPLSGEERVKQLLNEPSKDHAQLERQWFGSTDISYNVNQCLNVMGLSIVFFVHRLLLGIVYGVGSLFLLAIGFSKELLLAVSTYALVLMLLRENKGMAAKWFSSRIQWMLLFIIAHIAFSMLLFFTNQLVAKVTGYGLLMILPFDAILILLMKYAYNNKEELWQKITADIDLDGEGAFQIAKGVIMGDIAPKDVYEKRSERKRQEALDEENEDGDDTTETGSKKASSLHNLEDDKDLAEKETHLNENENENEDGEIGDDAAIDGDETASEDSEGNSDSDLDETLLKSSEAALFDEMDASAKSKQINEEENEKASGENPDLDEDTPTSALNEAMKDGAEAERSSTSPDLSHVFNEEDDDLGDKDTTAKNQPSYGDSDPDLGNKPKQQNKQQQKTADDSYKNDLDRFMEDLMKEDEETNTQAVTPDLDEENGK